VYNRLVVRIIPFADEYLGANVRIFSQVYSDDKGPYPEELAEQRLLDDLKSGRDCSFVALDDATGKCVGGIFNKIGYDEAGKYLYVDSIHVNPQYQKQGIGKKLLSVAIIQAKELGILSVMAFVDSGKKFPLEWYEKIGLEKTPWVGFVAKVGDLKV